MCIVNQRPSCVLAHILYMVMLMAVYRMHRCGLLGMKTLVSPIYRSSDVVLETTVSPRGSLKLDFRNVSVSKSKCLSFEVGKFRVNLTVRFHPGSLFNIDRCYTCGVIKTKTRPNRVAYRVVHIIVR